MRRRQIQEIPAVRADSQIQRLNETIEERSKQKGVKSNHAVYCFSFVLERGSSKEEGETIEFRRQELAVQRLVLTRIRSRERDE